ncbi:hypothetical protein V8F06_001842 [Rhypophila decipiens]
MLRTRIQLALLRISKALPECLSILKLVLLLCGLFGVEQDQGQKQEPLRNPCFCHLQCIKNDIYTKPDYSH